jgi:hypothetical protein
VKRLRNGSPGKIPGELERQSAVPLVAAIVEEEGDPLVLQVGIVSLFADMTWATVRPSSWA